MRKRDGRVVFSPSDVVTFLQSPFASWMDRQFLESPQTTARPDPRDPTAELWAKAGDQHERTLLVELHGKFGDVVSIANVDERFELTLEALKQGRAVVHQAALRGDGFEGFADFLLRVDVPSSLGGWSYIVADAKLARICRPSFLIQLCAYADMLEHVQGLRPATVDVMGGDGAQHRFRTDDFFYVYGAVKAQFLKFHGAFNGTRQPRPDGRINHGRWNSYALKILEDRDDVSLVANLTRNQQRRLRDAGVTTLMGLAECGLPRVPRVDENVYRALRDQARLQVLSRGRARPDFEIVSRDSGGKRAGLALLPAASPMDVYFDMEGFPLADGGLEYLFGAFYVERGLPQYRAWWAHDRDQERAAFESFMDWVTARFQSDPSMHIYHYASYEIVALRRLMGAFGTRENELDALLRGEAFVDLYKIVRQGLRVGEPRYSLKNVERIYRDTRAGGVATATESIVEYARWVEQRAPEILESIQRYNTDDCRSIWELAAFLRNQQREKQIGYIPPEKTVIGDAPVPEQWREAENAATQLREQTASNPAAALTAALLAELVTFHRRESKPFFWSLHERRKMSPEERFEDPDCLEGLSRTDREPESLRRSLVYEYKFDPDQETSIAAGDRCELLTRGLTDRSAVTVHTIDRSAGLVILIIGQTRPELPPEGALIPHDYVDPAPIVESLIRTSSAWLRTGKLPPALDDLITRRPPRIRGSIPGTPIVDPALPLSAQLDSLERVVHALDDSYLAIQGPPGTGKTFTAGRLIASLVRAGRRVAVSSNSHNAIDKLLAATAKVPGSDIRIGKIGARRGDDGEGSAFTQYTVPELVAESPPPNVVGATAWALSDPDLINAFDYLFVDEAGQVSLANFVGMALCARNLVLIGDQMQLAHPVRGSHPGDSGRSVLQYLLQGHATVPAQLGVFLSESRRLHPLLCEFISDVVYERRLRSAAEAAGRSVRARSGRPMRLPEAGLAFVPVEHEGNSRESDEEVEAVRRVVSELLECDWVASPAAAPRPVTRDDIIVVSPFNAQVRRLETAMPGVNVGTVDRFQGAEAPVVIVSMATSSGEESPRGIDFLFSINRLNVALSRAQALAILVAHPGLALTRVVNVEQMRRVNAFCRAISTAKRFDLGEVPSSEPKAEPVVKPRSTTERLLRVSKTDTHWAVDEAALARFAASFSGPSDSRAWFELRRDVEEFVLTPGFESLHRRSLALTVPTV